MPFCKCLQGAILTFLFTGALVSTVTAQPRQDQAFRLLFNEVLRAIQNNEGVLDPFGKEVDSVNAALVPSLNLLVASNIASFPLTSVISVGDVYIRTGADVPGGEMYVRREPLGPLFAETSRTIGKGSFDVGFNYSSFSFSRLRGRRLDELAFTFAPQNLGDVSDIPVRGDLETERETLEMTLDADIEARLFVLLGAFGLTRSLDVGIALPIIHLTSEIRARAQLSRNHAPYAFYFFNDDAFNPELERTASVSTDPVVGLGDIAIRVKYRLGEIAVKRQRPPVRAAVLADVRLPTGSKADFLGTGEPSARLLFVVDQQAEAFAPHLNVGYQYRGAAFDSDEIEYVLGLDLKLANSLDLLLDLLGEFDLASNEPLASLSGLEEVAFAEVRRSNIPARSRDHSLILSAGCKYAPTEQVTFIGNVLVPQADWGLSYPLASTFGLFINF